MPNQPTIKEFQEGDRDFGLEPPDTPLTEEEKKLAALTMGMNAAVVQFISEGIIPAEQQGHFMMHLQDFTALIYAGEKLNIDGTNQTLALNSVLGRLFSTAAAEALINGHKNFERIKEKELAQREANKQTSLESEVVNFTKPKWLN